MFKRIIQLSTEYILKEYNLEFPPIDISKLTANQANIYKTAAKRILKSDTYNEETKRIVKQTIDKLALKAANDVEIAYFRGIIAGIKLLDDNLRIIAQEPNNYYENTRDLAQL